MSRKKDCVFPIIVITILIIVKAISVVFEKKSRYRPKEKIIYRVISRDVQTDLSICSWGINNFVLLQIPKDITNGMYFVRNFSSYEIIDKSNK